MATQVESALHTLLPTLSFLPPDVVHLSKSLLAQSKSKAASLKPEEEIGRTYACCHIAAERLKLKLDLDDINAVPPVKPALYRKLYAYLDQALKTPVSVRTTPRSTRHAAKDPASASSKTTLNAIPSVRAALAETAPLLTPSRRRPGGLQRARPNTGVSVPGFASALITAICEHCGIKDAAPYVHVGLQSVLAALNDGMQESVSERQGGDGTPSKRRRTSTRTTQASAGTQGISDSQVSVLICCLYNAVAQRLHGAENDEDNEKSRHAFEALRIYRTEHPQELLPSSSDQDVQKYVEVFDSQAATHWPDMDWYQDVPTTESFEPRNDGEASDEDASPLRRTHTKTPLRRTGKRAQSHENDMGPAGLLPGLGTMFQPAVDWLSEQRREDYTAWKNDIMRQVAAVEQQG